MREGRDQIGNLVRSEILFAKDLGPVPLDPKKHRILRHCPIELVDNGTRDLAGPLPLIALAFQFDLFDPCGGENLRRWIFRNARTWRRADRDPAWSIGSHLSTGAGLLAAGARRAEPRRS